jgi:hypothetical protein
MQRIQTTTGTTERAGWSIREYLPLIGIGETTYHTLPPEQKPKYIKIGRRTIITEPPRAYVDRLARMQAETAEAEA